MKKKRRNSLIYLVLLVLIVSLFTLSTFALKYQVVQSTIPEVRVWLDELSVLEGAVIRNDEFKQEDIFVVIDQLDGELTKPIVEGEYYTAYSIKPKYSLANGDFTLTLDAVDFVNNRATYDIQFSIGGYKVTTLDK